METPSKKVNVPCTSQIDLFSISQHVLPLPTSIFFMGALGKGVEKKKLTLMATLYHTSEPTVTLYFKHHLWFTNTVKQESLTGCTKSVGSSSYLILTYTTLSIYSETNWGASLNTLFGSSHHLEQIKISSVSYQLLQDLFSGFCFSFF